MLDDVGGPQLIGALALKLRWTPYQRSKTWGQGYCEVAPRWQGGATRTAAKPPRSPRPTDAKLTAAATHTPAARPAHPTRGMRAAASVIRLWVDLEARGRGSEVMGSGGAPSSRGSPMAWVPSPGHDLETSFSLAMSQITGCRLAGPPLQVGWLRGRANRNPPRNTCHECRPPRTPARSRANLSRT